MSEDVEKEFFLFVDYGVFVKDVIVEYFVYGELIVFVMI